MLNLAGALGEALDPVGEIERFPQAPLPANLEVPRPGDRDLDLITRSETERIHYCSG